MIAYVSHKVDQTLTFLLTHKSVYSKCITAQRQTVLYKNLTVLYDLPSSRNYVSCLSDIEQEDTGSMTIVAQAEPQMILNGLLGLAWQKLDSLGAI